MQPERPPYEEPVGRWGTTWRLILCVSVSTLAWWEISQAQWHHARPLFFLDGALGAISFVLVWWRRRHPFAIALATGLFGLVSASAAGPSLLAFASFCTRRRLTPIAFIGAVSVAAGQLFYYYEPRTTDDAPWVNFTTLIVITAAVAATAMYVGSRRELLWTLRQRARDAEAESELRQAQARSTERERIAREMHDVLAHRISLITMHSGALAYREDLSPEQVRESAQLIADTSHEALTDLREVLGALRREEPMRPQPTLCDLPALIAESSDTDQRITLHMELDDPSAVPDRIGRTAFRICQEALTNVRKHAPGQRGWVRVSGHPGDGLRLVVHNDRSVRAAASSPGFGLVGMRERVELAGGRLDITTNPESFEVDAWLPWPA